MQIKEEDIKLYGKAIKYANEYFGSTLIDLSKAKIKQEDELEWKSKNSDIMVITQRPCIFKNSSLRMPNNRGV